MQSVENIIIVFAPGLGGNHLANLISMAGKHWRDVDLDGYLKPNLGRADAHYNHRDIVPDPNRSNVTATHLRIFLSESHFHGLPNSRYVVMQFPNLCEDSLALRRLLHYATARTSSTALSDPGSVIWSPVGSVFWELDSMYKQDILHKIFPGSWQTFMSDTLFDSDIDRLSSEITRVFDVVLPDRNQLETVHLAWLEKIKQNLQSDRA